MQTHLQAVPRPDRTSEIDLGHPFKLCNRSQL